MSELLRDFSPLQIGTTGFYAGHKFTIVGRQKLSWEQGYWLEWYLQFDDGRNGWLAEAQGFYGLLFATSETLPALENLQPEYEYSLRGKPFVVADIKKAAISEKSGEGPGTLNETSIIVDLSGPEGGFASIDYNTKTLYLGTYVDFALFNFQNLKSKSSSSTFQFSSKCPDCGTPYDLVAGDQTLRVGCLKCRALYDPQAEGQSYAVGHQKKWNDTLAIPIGTKGKLNGAEWTVIGYMERHDGPYYWNEYLLYEQTKGFRWLFEMNGHWSFITPLKEKPSDGSSGLTTRFRGRTYRLFNRGNAVVSKVAGEFYWHVLLDETAKMADFINPPEMLSMEKSKNEVVWSLGTYVTAREIKNAFNVKAMPYQTGVGANQPGGADNGIVKAWLGFVGVLILLQIFHVSLSANAHPYTKSFTFASTDVVKTQASEPFMLAGGAKNVEMSFSAPIDNNWLEVQGELVNDQTGEVFEFEQGIEFYSGYDSDGAWTEGSRATEVDLSAVPGGTYHVNVEVSGPALSTQPMSVFMQVDRDVPTWGNFWWSLLLISVFPLFSWSRSRAFETRRWSNSDYSPYGGG